MYLLLGLLGLHYTTAFSNSLLLATTPLLATLFLWGFRLESIGPLQWLGMGLSVLGMVVFVWEKLHTGLPTASLGDGLSLVAAIGFAGYTVLNKQLVARYAVIVVMAVTLTMGAILTLSGLVLVRCIEARLRETAHLPQHGQVATANR